MESGRFGEKSSAVHSNVIRAEVTLSCPPLSLPVVRPVGQLDLDSAPSLTRMITGCLGRSSSVVIDASGIDFIDCAGLHALFPAWRIGPDPVLVLPSDCVRRLLDLLGLDVRWSSTSGPAPVNDPWDGGGPSLPILGFPAGRETGFRVAGQARTADDGGSGAEQQQDAAGDVHGAGLRGGVLCQAGPDADHEDEGHAGCPVSSAMPLLPGTGP